MKKHTANYILTHQLDLLSLAADETASLREMLSSVGAYSLVKGLPHFDKQTGTIVSGVGAATVDRVGGLSALGKMCFEFVEARRHISWVRKLFVRCIVGCCSC